MLRRVNDVLGSILDAVQNVDPVLRTLIAGLAMMLETSILIGLVVPGDSIVLVSSTGVASPLEGVALAIAIVVGSLIGESIGFTIGRWFGHRLPHSRIGRRIGRENWERAERYLDRRGGIAVAISRFLPVLHSLIPITVGMSSMSYRRFLAWTAPACVLWAAIYVSVGSVAAGGFRDLDSRAHWAGYAFAGVIALFAVAVVVVKRVVHRLERRHLDADHLGE